MPSDQPPTLQDLSVPNYPETIDLHRGSIAELQVLSTLILQFGIAIEQMDIDELKNAIAESTNPTQTRIYTNLMRGSVNHLNAFQTAKTNGSLDCDTANCPNNGFRQGRGNGRGAGYGQGLCPNGGLGPRQGMGMGRGRGSGLGQHAPLGIKGENNGVCDGTGPGSRTQ